MRLHTETLQGYGSRAGRIELRAFLERKAAPSNELRARAEKTTLCYTKLTELLDDARFRDICTVELQAQGYMMVPATGIED